MASPQTDRSTELEFDALGRHRDGGKFRLDASLGAFQRDGETMYTGILRDITERKRREQTSVD